MSEEWASEEESVTDNFFSKSILFKNKIRITSAVEKLVLHQDMKFKQPLDDLQKIGTKILEKIKDAKYAGVGINFLSTLNCEDPGEEIKKRFLKHIPKLPLEKIIGGSFSYIYNRDKVQVTITITPVKKAAGAKENAISLSANYHFETNFVKKMQDFITEMPALKEDYLGQSKNLFV